MANQKMLVIGGLGLLFLVPFLLRKKKAPEVLAPEIPQSLTTEEAITSAYSAAGYSGKQLTDIVNAVVQANEEAARIASQTPTATNSEITNNKAVAITQVNEAVSSMETSTVSGGQAYEVFTPEKIEYYKSVPVHDIYGNPVDTKEEALACANQQLKVASKQTDPGIRASMMLIAEGMFEQAEALP